MNYVAFQAAVWIAAGFVLVMLVIRRASQTPPSKTNGLSQP